MYQTYNDAVIGKHVKLPPKHPKDHKVPCTDGDLKPPALVITTTTTTKEEESSNNASIPNLHDSDSISTNITGLPLVAYQPIEKPPLVTPANYQQPKTIVQ